MRGLRAVADIIAATHCRVLVGAGHVFAGSTGHLPRTTRPTWATRATALGVDLTGVSTNRKLPKTNYQVDLDAMRVNGSDFFVGLTFPVKDKPCSLICGGWGGGVCGLSSIDGMDASENATTTYRGFEKGKWFHIRLRVHDKRIQAWIDDKQIVDQDIAARGSDRSAGGETDNTCILVSETGVIGVGAIEFDSVSAGEFQIV